MISKFLTFALLVSSCFLSYSEAKWFGPAFKKMIPVRGTLQINNRVFHLDAEKGFRPTFVQEKDESAVQKEIDVKPPQPDTASDDFDDEKATTLASVPEVIPSTSTTSAPTSTSTLPSTTASTTTTTTTTTPTPSTTQTPSTASTLNVEPLVKDTWSKTSSSLRSKTYQKPYQPHPSQQQLSSHHHRPTPSKTPSKVPPKAPSKTHSKTHQVQITNKFSSPVQKARTMQQQFPHPAQAQIVQ